MWLPVQQVGADEERAASITYVPHLAQRVCAEVEAKA